MIFVYSLCSYVACGGFWQMVYHVLVVSHKERFWSTARLVFGVLFDGFIERFSKWSQRTLPWSTAKLGFGFVGF